MELYVYAVDGGEVVAIITGSDNAACESVASERFGDTDTFGWTYTPAFGTNDGLVETADCEQIEAA